MNIALGQIIKKLRTEKGITQEQLANHLGLTCQAVSKWENGTTYPDITLLPELAIFFGVSIDNLFSIDREDHLKRIDNMIWNEYNISPENFIYADKILNEMIEENPNDGAAYARKSRLYQQRSNRDKGSAGWFAELGIEAEPFNMEAHGAYLDIRRGDFNRQIFFYSNFIEKYPEWIHGYFFLIDAYINDFKLVKASEIIEKARKVENHPKLALFECDVHILNNEKDKAFEILERAVEEFENDSMMIEGVADRFAKLELYDRAIVLWNKAYEIPPHYLGGIYAMAFLFDRLGRYEEAIEQWERIIYAQKTYWNTAEGETINWPLREIEKLKLRIASRDKN